MSAVKAEMGELLVGAYLKEIEGCDFVDYNVRPAGGGLAGLNEIDVLGLRFSDKTVFLCEVTTHIRGALYGTYNETDRRIGKKFRRMKVYAKSSVRGFGKIRFMFWSPRVPEGKLMRSLERYKGLELVVNAGYRKKVEMLQDRARKRKHDSGNPFFRALQILGCLRG
ncbi:MAG TPA: hypothetical protein PLN89_07795 [Elusimicrobiota bacterium]|nr:hypothetical protein [Anaerolineales bacterium]HNF59460.1 hypothetical protein [Elusimicrobiota bacterium]